MIELIDEDISVPTDSATLKSIKGNSLDSTGNTDIDLDNLEDETDDFLNVEDEENKLENEVFFSRHSEGELYYGNFWAFYPNKDGILQFYIGPDCKNSIFF